MPTLQDFRHGLERGSDDVKLDTLRRIISQPVSVNGVVPNAELMSGAPAVGTLNGQPQPALLMDTIRFALPSRNKSIKKLYAAIKCVQWSICSRPVQPPLLLGGLSQIRRNRKAQARNDPSVVRFGIEKIMVSL